MSREFAQIPLGKIRTDKALPADVFVKVNEKYIRFKYKDDSIDPEKYDLFLSKKTQFLYIDKNDEDLFNKWLLVIKKEEIDNVVNLAGEENRDMAEATYEIKEKINDTFSSIDLKEEAVRILLEDTEKLVKVASEKKRNKDSFALMASYHPALADHCVSVASISVFLAMNLGQNHNLILQNIYMGGLYHDYGKTKIAPKILENKNSPSYVNAINVHATMGREALEKMQFLPPQILNIIEEHHEQFNGGGVPYGKKEDEIYGLSKIVSIANVFDNIVTEDKIKKHPKGIFHRAFKILELDNGKMFDPSVLGPSLEALKEAVKNRDEKLF